MQKFLKYLGVHALNSVNFEKKKMTPLTNKQQELYEKTKICNISKKRWNKNTLMIKTIVKLKTLVMILVNTVCATHSMFNLKYSVPKEILVVFHDVSNYDYHFTIKELAK